MDGRDSGYKQLQSGTLKPGSMEYLACVSTIVVRFNMLTIAHLCTTV